MTIDVTQQVAYWRDSSAEDLAAADSLLEKGHVRHALFFAHLGLEKMLKAHVCATTRALAPKIHNLLVLCEKGKVAVTNADLLFLAEMDDFNLAGRYPQYQNPIPSAAEASALLAKVKELHQCLNDRL